MLNRVSAVSLALAAAWFAFLLGTYSISGGGGTYGLGWRADWLALLGRPLWPGTRVNFALLVLLSTALLPTVWLIDFLLHLPANTARRRRLEAGLCAACGYDVRASLVRCPECGTSLVTPAAPYVPPKLPDPCRRAIASLGIAAAVALIGSVVFNLPPRDREGQEMVIVMIAAVFFAAPAYGIRLGVSSRKVRGTRGACAIAGIAANVVVIVIGACHAPFVILGQ